MERHEETVLQVSEYEKSPCQSERTATKKVLCLTFWWQFKAHSDRDKIIKI